MSFNEGSLCYEYSYKIVLPPILAVITVFGLAALTPSHAYAALEGDNGRILYTDITSSDVNKETETEESVSQVITSASDGTGNIVAAETSNGVETATISAPDTDGNHTIVYSEQAKCTNDSKVIDDTDSTSQNPCTGEDPNLRSQASISSVTIDKNGNPISNPENVVTFNPMIEGVPVYDSVRELSISPDGKNVLVTRVTDPMDYSQSIWEGYTGGIVPGIYQDNTDLELGLKFKSSIDGYVAGASVYVPACNNYDSEGLYNPVCTDGDYAYYDINLWAKNGTLLASNNDIYIQTYHQYSQWQSLYFAEPVDIQADRIYTISYSPSNKRYAATNNSFSSDVTNGVLTALKSKSSRPNGVISASPGVFPVTSTGNDSNYWVDPIFMLYKLTTIENVNLETGQITTIVAPRVDGLLSGGYAQNGNIYFSRTNSKNGNPSDAQSNIWVIASGQTEATKLTHSKNVSEFYIDAAPDNSVLLVADVEDGCNYPQNKYHYYTGCTYFYVSVVDGSREKLKKLAEGFVPVFFSPDGTQLIGTLYPASYYGEASRNMTRNPVTAVVARANLKVATEISTNRGVQEWAPLLSPALSQKHHTYLAPPQPPHQLQNLGSKTRAQIVYLYHS
ncbi:DUF4082 domain-containing protein [Candidatus Saccharibacteria bacterium]|nr:MAG: DUF4082 domain-containing protein [Candidatus Saccharibacteria bacterium]